MFPPNLDGKCAAFPTACKVPTPQAFSMDRPASAQVSRPSAFAQGDNDMVKIAAGKMPTAQSVVFTSVSGGGGGKVSVNAPKTPVTEKSSGVKAAVMPNVCKMPGPPAPFVPVPLPNIGKSDNSPSGYSTKVMFIGAKVAIKGATFKSMGDIPSQGTGGGLISASVQDVTEFVGPGSMNVCVEGKAVQLLGDAMTNNKKNAM